MCKCILSSGPNKGKKCSRSPKLEWCYQHENEKCKQRKVSSRPPSPKRVSPKPKSPAKKKVAKAAKQPKTVKLLKYNEGIFKQVEEGNVEAIKQYIRDNGDVNIKTDTEFSLLYFAENVDIAKILLQNDADPNVKNGYGGITSFYKAARNGDVEMCELLLEYKADIDAADATNGMSALHNASRDSGNPKMCKFLIDRGANVNLKNKDNGNSPLHISILTHRDDLANILIKGKADVDLKNNDGDTPLHLAADYGLVKICQMLLDHRANINAKNKEGNTPLQYAARNGQVESCKFLIENGAILTLKNKDKKTVLQMLKEDLRGTKRDKKSRMFEAQAEILKIVEKAM